MSVFLNIDVTDVFAHSVGSVSGMVYRHRFGNTVTPVPVAVSCFLFFKRNLVDVFPVYLVGGGIDENRLRTFLPDMFQHVKCPEGIYAEILLGDTH